jgi:hypothetical protein
MSDEHSEESAESVEYGAPMLVMLKFKGDNSTGGENFTPQTNRKDTESLRAYATRLRHSFLKKSVGRTFSSIVFIRNRSDLANEELMVRIQGLVPPEEYEDLKAYINVTAGDSYTMVTSDMITDIVGNSIGITGFNITQLQPKETLKIILKIDESDTKESPIYARVSVVYFHDDEDGNLDFYLEIVEGYENKITEILNSAFEDLKK